MPPILAALGVASLRTFGFLSGIGALPSYLFGAIPTQIYEGAAVGTFNVTTTLVPNGTTLYWTINHVTTTAADFSATSGSFTINNGTGSFTVSAVGDTATEGNETFTVSIRTDSISGPIVATSSSVVLGDVTYSFTTVPSGINEGNTGSFIVGVGGEGLPNGTTLYWTINHISTSVGDFSATSGSFTVTSNSGSFSITTLSDTAVEGTESFTVSIRTGSTVGPVVLTSSTVNLGDITYSITPPASINEGSAGTFNVSIGGAGIPNNTTLYWTINHVTTTAADFSATSGSFTVTGNSASFTITPTADNAGFEGPETFTVSLRTGSISGTIVATSASVTVNDTSLPSAPTTFEYLVIAGGGGGGGNPGSSASRAGGGGAGGYRTSPSYPITPGTTYTITVGGGGGTDSNGTNSSITTPGPAVNCVGGGWGGRRHREPEVPNWPGASGGSGGGGGGSDGGTASGGLGTPGEGNGGGTLSLAGAPVNTTIGGGGGGAGAAGSNGSAVPVHGRGGAGVTSTFSGTPANYAGGGSGAGGVTNPIGAAPAYGGGANEGGGGGSGVVMIRYPSTLRDGLTTGSPTFTTLGAPLNLKLYTFTGSGTIRWN